MLHREPDRKWKNFNSNNNVRNSWNSAQRDQWDLEKVNGSQGSLEMKVETVDYYSRNDQFHISTHRPPLLNSLGESLCLQHITQVEMPLDTSGFSDGPVENNMEALLNYIKSHPGVLENVDFVTYRQILASAAANKTRLDIQAIRRHGRIWIRKLEDSRENIPGEVYFSDMARAVAFEKELLEVDDDVDSRGFPRRNGLFKATLGAGREEPGIRILYPGELDAVNSSGANVEIKSTLRDDTLKRRGGYYYWQSHLGNVEKIIMGRIYVDTCRSIKTLSLEDMKLELQPLQWSAFAVNQGAQRILKMLEILRKHLKDDGDSVVMSRSTRPGWHFVEDSWKVDVEKKVSPRFEELVQDLFLV